MRIAVVHASDAIVSVLERAIHDVSGWTLAWHEADARRATGHTLADRPDVLLLQSSSMAVDATRQIMETAPCGIILLVDPADRNSGRVFEAMSVGAIDVVTTPTVDGDGRLAGTSEVIRKIRTAARLALSLTPSTPARRATAALATSTLPSLVMLGASTGGPAALVRVLAAIPQTFEAAFVVVQHVGAQFCEELSEWLAGQISHPVRTVASGDRPRTGVVMLAGGNDNLVMTPSLELAYQRPARNSFYHPSVDVLFKSVAACWPVPGIAALLTGIGRDGAEGLLALRNARWTTIAQDERTSVVYGMPKAAAEIQAATQILPIDQIGPAIVRFAPLPRATEAARE